jgi:hypothetical protein
MEWLGICVGLVIELKEEVKQPIPRKNTSTSLKRSESVRCRLPQVFRRPYRIWSSLQCRANTVVH